MNPSFPVSRLGLPWWDKGCVWESSLLNLGTAGGSLEVTVTQRGFCWRGTKGQMMSPCASRDGALHCLFKGGGSEKAAFIPPFFKSRSSFVPAHSACSGVERTN